MEGEEEDLGEGEAASEVAPARDQEEAGSQEDLPHAHLHQDHHHQVEPGAHQAPREATPSSSGAVEAGPHQEAGQLLEAEALSTPRCQAMAAPLEAPAASTATSHQVS